MASLKVKAKVLLRSGSLSFARDYFKRGGGLRERAVYDWSGMPVVYRKGTSDVSLIYSIMLMGRKSEYAIPEGCNLDPGSVRTVLDVGANAGISTLYLARLFPRATVHAFEPEPGNCEILRSNAAAEPRVKVHEVALGAEDGVLRLFDSDDAANLGGFSAHGQGVDAARSKEVPLRHAGRMLAQLGVAAVDVIKIDTEGSEWEILTSLDRAMLSGVRLIMGELHGRRDFALLDYLEPTFHIAMRKRLRSRLFNFYAANRES